MADIDPNFLNQALRSGETAASRVAAINDTNSVIAARNAQTQFNYGPQAYKAREADINRVDAGTAYQGLINETQQLTINERKANETAYGEIENAVTAQNYQIQQRQNEGTLAILNSPVIQQSAVKFAENTSKLALNNIEAQIQNQDMEHQQQAAVLKTSTQQAIENSLLATQHTAKTQNLANTQSAVSKAMEVDRARGDGTYSAQIELIKSLALSNNQQFQDSMEWLNPIIDKIAATNELPVPIQDAVDTARKVIKYNSSTAGISSTLSNMHSAATQGQLNDADTSVLSAVKLTGLDPTDPTAGKNFSIDYDEKAQTYTILNSATGLRSPAISQQMAMGSPEFQKLFVDATNKNLTQNNVLTAQQAVQKSLQSIAATGLKPWAVESLASLNQGLNAEIRSPAVTNQVGQIMGSLQNEIARANPLYSPDVAENVKGDLPFGIPRLSDLSTTFGAGSAKLEEEVKKNPLLKSQLVKAYNNRSTGGISPVLYKHYVTQIRDVIANADPGTYRVSPTNPQAVVNERLANLTNQIQRNLKMPVIADLPSTTKEILGITDAPAYTPIGGRLRSIRDTLLGNSLESMTYNEAVPQTTVDVNAR